jgi:hypothetical protein
MQTRVLAHSCADMSTHTIFEQFRAPRTHVEPCEPLATHEPSWMWTATHITRSARGRKHTCTTASHMRCRGNPHMPGAPT